MRLNEIAFLCLLKNNRFTIVSPFFRTIFWGKIRNNNSTPFLGVSSSEIK